MQHPAVWFQLSNDVSLILNFGLEQSQRYYSVAHTGWFGLFHKHINSGSPLSCYRDVIMKTMRSLFAQKSWANNELFNLLATIDPVKHADAVHAATRMLQHIYVVDRMLRAHLLAEMHGYTSTNTEATPALGELQFLVAETYAWYQSCACTATEARLGESIIFRFTDGDAGMMTREEMPFHVITHGAYHRGNVGQMLKLISVASPRDLYTKFLHVTEPVRKRAS